MTVGRQKRPPEQSVRVHHRKKTCGCARQMIPMRRSAALAQNAAFIGGGLERLKRRRLRAVVLKIWIRKRPSPVNLRKSVVVNADKPVTSGYGHRLVQDC